MYLKTSVCSTMSCMEKDHDQPIQSNDVSTYYSARTHSTMRHKITACMAYRQSNGIMYSIANNANCNDE